MASSTSGAASSASRSMNTSNQSRGEYDPSLSSEEPRSEYTTTSEKRRPRWMSQVKNWLATSEPSAQAMKDQKKDAFKKHGVDIKDPQAAAKMHSPLGKVPLDAITSTSGPTPEKALKEKVRVKETPTSGVRHTRGSQSVSSSVSSLPSVKSSKVCNTIAPWEELE